MLKSAPVFTLFGLLAFASPISQECISSVVPITISTTGVVLRIPQFNGSLDTQGFLVRAVTRGADSTGLLGDAKNLTKTFHINMRYCPATTEDTKGTVQVLTHGVGFDQR
jgi:hypothetical protein